MRHLSIDIETYSDVSLPDSGVWAYSEGEDFEVLLFSYAVDFGDVHCIDLAQGESIPQEIRNALKDKNVIKHAYNAPFEITCLNRAGYETPANQWHCTMFHGLYLGYPAGLALIGEALGLDKDKLKDPTGKALIRFFSIPCKPTKSNGGRTRNLPHHDPGKWKLYKKYNTQDVVTEMEIYKRLALIPVPDREQALWVLEQNYHHYGIPVDMDLIQGAIAIRERRNADLLEEAKAVTGLDNPNSRSQMMQWVEEKLGHELPNFTKTTVSDLIEKNEDPDVTKALEIRQELSKTSLAKYDAFLAACGGDGRVHGAHQIYGANRTGRWAGRIIQPQNLPRNYLPLLDQARAWAKAQNADMLRYVYGDNITDTLSQLLRTVIIPSPGNKLVVADFSAIEARVIAWLAGEEWVNEVFRTHGRIYEATASQMFGVPVEKIKKGNPEYSYRQKGKVATLALGYQGGVGALKAMGAERMGIPEEELPEIVQRWRKANPSIVALWYALDEAALKVVDTGEPETVRRVALSIALDPIYGQRFLRVKLPSGRCLYYVNPRITEGQYGDQITYLDTVNGKVSDVNTYGGKLTENIVQAIARDCLAELLFRIHSKGYPIIMHIHDEVVLDVPQTVKKEDIYALMAEPIPWAPGLVLKGDGFEADFYQKD
jgi:DNA polymerase